MPKKIKDGKSLTPGSSSSDEQKKSSARDEIDAIFASVGKKRKKPDDVKDKKSKKKEKESIVKDPSSKKVSKIPGSGKKISKKNDSSSKNENRDRGPRKRTGDGLAVYTEEELGFGNPNAGGTRLCPFDCDCCF